MNANHVGVPGTVTKAGARTLILTASIAFSGGLIALGGTLTTANAGGLETVPVTNNGTIALTEET